tara:strand:- start:162 stop:1247 length:1086 start_codon:yes stop_codon:yes gene_type:complete
MRLLLISRLFFPLTGGVATEYNFLYNKLKSKKYNFNISILTSKNSEKNIYEKHKSSFILRSIFDYQNKKFFFFKLLYLIFSIISCFLTFLFVSISQKKFDIVQIHSNFLFIKKSNYINYFILIFKFLGKKSVLDIKDLSSYPSKDLGFDHYLVNSQNTYNLVSKYISPKKIKLIYSPLIKNKNKNKIKKKIGQILYIGTISNQKGVQELINAFPINYKKTKKKKVELHLYGEIVDKIKLNKNTFYKGILPHNKAINKIKQSEILVLPSFSESLPRVVLEAIFYNTKVLTSKGVPEIDKSLNSKNKIQSIKKKIINKQIKFLLTKKLTQKYNYDFSKHEDEFIKNQFNIFYKSLKKNEFEFI